MTKRKILYGYQIRGGALEIVPEEQRVVQTQIVTIVRQFSRSLLLIIFLYDIIKGSVRNGAILYGTT